MTRTAKPQKKREPSVGLYSISLELNKKLTLYTVYLSCSDYCDTDSPAIGKDGLIIMSQVSDPLPILKECKGFADIPYKLPLPVYGYSIPKVLDIALKNERDAQHDIVDTIIFLADCIDACREKAYLSRHLQFKILIAAQCFLTLDTSILHFVRETTRSRDELHGALIWAVGVVLKNARFI